MGIFQKSTVNLVQKTIQNFSIDLEYPRLKAWENNLILFENSMDNNPHKPSTTIFLD